LIRQKSVGSLLYTVGAAILEALALHKFMFSEHAINALMMSVMSQTSL